ncbi:MAG: xanthine dehydrogenase family protein [Ectothiorhodospiraceae bacterium]|nr:xanthine dehydrogenase family protein [Ectothiorhodospiraceae bacterium]
MGDTSRNEGPSEGWIGRPVKRREDLALLTGRGHFIDDLSLPGQVWAWFVRSPYAAARIGGLDTQAACDGAGVVAVLTAADLDPEPAARITSRTALRGRDGRPPLEPTWRLLADDSVHYLGEPVAMVLAESEAAAREAAMLVEVEYEPLPAVTDGQAAVARDAPLVWPDLGTNVALDWERGDAAAVDAAFARAAHVTRVSLRHNRVVVAAMEPRGVLADHDPQSDRYTVRTPTQGGGQVRMAIAEPGLGVSPAQVRVVTPDVGGGFGIKNGVYAEQILAAFAARRLGRPVKWYADRSDSFVADYHARDHHMEAELALDADGRFLAVRSRVIGNMGAYLTGEAPVIPTAGGTRCLTNLYRIPVIHAQTRCVYTNTTPIAAYRGAGKPEYTHLVEHLVDAAARELGIAPQELRRRNLITSGELPWTTPTGLVYDSGDFAATMDAALARAGLDGLARRKSEARARGKLLGQGFAVYTEPDGFKDNRVRVAFEPDGRATVLTTAQTNGQGHHTVYAQIAATILGLDIEAVDVVEGDTDRVGHGSGTGGSRSTTVTGAGIHRAGLEVIEQARQIAAHLMEADVADIEAGGGRFTVVGTDRSLTWRDVARAALDPARQPPGREPGLEATCHYDAPVYCYPSGCHVCEVEIDADTGALEVTRYLLVSDFGVIINPLLLEGQLHGGIAQGLGQALWEDTVYDADGQLLTGSFMDYCLPRADQLPMFEMDYLNTHCGTNPLGVKGCGESGPTAALPAATNAVRDALDGHDLDRLEMPLTSERIWRVLQRKRSEPST